MDFGLYIILYAYLLFRLIDVGESYHQLGAGNVLLSQCYGRLPVYA
ncbi:MAG: hypothetical protein JXA46_11480 [Dehalococcoidales bacterium]|nr:hypothetical protein [Dehalococcoidales bacterium]